MSTTTDMRVAVHYGLSAGSLLFLLKVDNFLQYGAELQWLSAFPGEAEVNAQPGCSRDAARITQLLRESPPCQSLQAGKRSQQALLASGLTCMCFGSQPP